MAFPQRGKPGNKNNSVLLEETTRGSVCIWDQTWDTTQDAGFPYFENKARQKKVLGIAGFQRERGAAKCQENQSR